MSKKFKIGVVGIPGKWSTETLADAVESATGYRLVIDMTQVKLDLTTMTLMYGDVDLSDLDGLIIKKVSSTYAPSTLDRVEMLRILEAKGVRVFNSTSAMMGLIDRLSCTITMRNADIPMPKTSITEDVNEAMAVVKEFGQAVFKPLFSTKARGMTIIDSELSDSKMKKAISEFKQKNPVMYIQKKVNLSGQDLGVVFLGGKYLCTYARVAQNASWNTTIHSGGRYDAYQPSDEIIAIAEKAQSLFNMDFTTVDVALTDEGPIVFEVSAFGGFKGVKEGCNIDAAPRYVEHVLNTLARQ